MKRSLAPLALSLTLLAACADGSGERAGIGTNENAARRAPVATSHAPICAEPAEGCACAGNQAPVSCVPSAAELGVPADENVCYEGTRRCVAGVFGACEDVRGFAAPADSASALVSLTAEHPRCEQCSPRCFVVRDELSPDDGPLSSLYADGIAFHSSGAGITLQQENTVEPPPILGLPIGSLLAQVAQGLSASARHTHQYVASRTDVYILADHSQSMSEETQWFVDRYLAGATYVDGRTRCVGGDQSLVTQGVLGAARCMIDDVSVGSGTFGDLPFTAYAGDEAVMEPMRSQLARFVMPYVHNVSILDDVDATFGLRSYGSTGSPDVAGSQIPALYSLATGRGLYAGPYRYAVPPSSCADGLDGQACFRPDANRVVIMLGDAPMHNGPDPARFPYDYAASELETSLGGGGGPIVVPPDNENWDSAFHITNDASGEQVVVVGDTSTQSSDVPGTVVACTADEHSPDAVFTFDVMSPSGNANVHLSAAGTRFESVLAVFSAPPHVPERLESAGDINELFASAHDLGDVTGRSLLIPGDTTAPASSGDMSADYQSSLLGPECDASSLAPDAVYAFDVDSASRPLRIELSADMGVRRAVLAVYEDTGVRRWPASDAPLTATGNSDAFPANVFEIPSGAGNEYVTVRGNTATLGADYNAADLGGTLCSPEDAANDAAFQIRVEGTRTLRFDTEGSRFDTVLSLHERAPLTSAGAMLRWPAADTHRNMNEDAASAHDVGDVSGRAQIFEGNTAGMRADVTDTFGCGTQATCGDAVYRMHVSERTALRIDASGTGYDPGVVITREDPQGVSGKYLPIAAGGRHTCAISAGEVFCWGADDQGQLGNGGAAGAPDSSAAVRVTGITGAQSVCAGTLHACAVTTDGRVHCWGAGGQGRLGNGSDAGQTAPVLATGIGEGEALGPAAQVSCGEAFTCALLRDGRVACFGANVAGQLGDNTMDERLSPVLVSTAERFEQVDAGHRHACAIRTSDDAVFCWGEGMYGKLGDNATTNNVVPARVGMLAGATYVMAGDHHTCAALSSGRVNCWGRNNVGQLGRGTTGTGNQATPVVVRNADNSADLANVRGGMAAGEDHTCVTTLEGYVMCWGGNANREIGHNNSAAPVTRPVGVSNLLDAVQVASSQDHTCAVRANGTLMCWGANADAQLGDGTTTRPAVPVRSQASATQAVAFGDGTVDAAFTQACQSSGQPPEQGCELRSHGDQRYFFCDGSTHSRTWAGAAQACEAVGMQLAVVDEAGENAFIASQLEGGEQAWLGVKRESDDSWLNLGDEPHFEDIHGNRVWYTEGSSWLSGITGVFTDAAALDLVDSHPRWTSSSTWARNEPSGGDGENCVTIDGNGEWRTARCSAIPERDCGFFGLACLFGFLGDLVGGILDWIVPWVGDVTRLVFDSLGGRYASPQFSGGVDHAYVCEAIETPREITLDPGDYYVTVKGIDDGVTGNTCEGPYELTLTDLGAPGGGFLACDDNGVQGTTSSVVERTLTTGDYYVILKGKHAADEGDYQLTVRDVTALPPATPVCDRGLGWTIPASIAITARPGRRYYALVKGDGALDRGAFDLRVEDAAAFGSTQIDCDGAVGASDYPELDLSLPSGRYYAVLKGQAMWHADTYQLTIGNGGVPTSGTFDPPDYDEALQALADSDIRVGTVLSCDPSVTSCMHAREQATLLAEDTGGAVAMASNAEDVPLQFVRVLEQITAADRIAGELVFAPDLNPGFTPYSVEAVPDPGNRCEMGADGESFVDCAPGATPAFLVTLHNPLLAPVAIATNALGLYEFTLRVTTEREGDPMRVDEVPIFARSTGAAEPGSYSQGEYFQDFSASGCERINAMGMDVVSRVTPSWDELRFDGDVLPDTSITFYACGVASETDFDDCDDPARRHRVLTVSAGADAGTPCTAATQATDCPLGYCSPYSNLCQFLEGASCEADDDCRGSLPGRCRMGPSAATLGRTCQVEDLIADPASALGNENLSSLRMTASLESVGDGSRTPSLFWWEARYNCRNTE